MSVLLNTLIVVLTVAVMEVVATLAHRYIMHGIGWGWHRSHHEPRTGWFERNDLYAVVFALLAIVLIAFGTAGAWPLQWIGAGMTAYGAIYFVLHDGLVHKRWPFSLIPRRGYMKRLYRAHRLHHAVKGREDGVSFGFIYAPPVEKLEAELKRRQASAGAARGSSSAASSCAERETPAPPPRR
ncbi:sterol desaturase family protein [Halomonas sp. 707D7]|uniref:sterol desaturase family protein n=2 Tax=unclassified Halomonas TaxID=2609666 RepID=UPI0020A1689B|nr:sterol desaturase family protein [Halomonas sp. 707D7]MCP1314839.1 sterol desaturase family protein [Halomonas sp. 707D7]